MRSIVRLAADLGIQTVAEGVETADQLDFFVTAGCDYTQGYLHGRPGPAHEVVGAFTASGTHSSPGRQPIR